MTSERATAVRDLLRRIDDAVTIGPVAWTARQFSYLDLAINYTLRRQREALGASLMLVEGGLGHLSVGFVGFREHLSEFALDRLWRLWFHTAVVVSDRSAGAGANGFQELIQGVPTCCFRRSVN